MKVAIPSGDSYGWGIAGTYLAREIAKLPPVEGVTLHCVAGHNFEPSDASQWSRINIEYCFFEHEIIAYRFIPQAAKKWDHIVADSSWCEHHLKIAGMGNSSTILQGIDPAVFQKLPERVDDGFFTVFSGGKFEFRKGLDLVVAAMKIFMARHPDVRLSCAWHNHWPQSIKTMEQSRFINFRYSEMPAEALYMRLLEENGIDTNRVILNPVMDNSLMRKLYASADLGLFPNRCEGGNNMVMCEFMACGRPVIASNMTGHQDVVSDANSLCLTVYEPVFARLGEDVTGVWFEPLVDEILYLLEQAYADRPMLRLLGDTASMDMGRLSWSEAARSFHRLAVRLAAEREPVLQVLTEKTEDTFECANRLFADQQYAEAEACFRRMLVSAPFDPFIHNALGTVLDRLECYPEAVLYYEKALTLRPDFVDARFNLANTLKRMGNAEGAIENLKLVVAVKPNFFEAWQNLALCLFDAGQFEGAAEALERVLTIRPDCMKSRFDLGNVLMELGKFKPALDCFRSVLLLEPDDHGALNPMGMACQELGDLDGAEGAYRRIIALDPENVLALNNLGTVLRCRAKFDEAIACFDRALEKEQNDGQLIFNRSLVRLVTGDFVRGWQDYERRFERAEPVKLFHDDIPRWNGEPLAGRRLLVQSEQGYGDTFQFVRYLSLLKGFDGPVIFECQDVSVKAALYGLEGVEAVFARGEKMPDAAFQVPLLSLPGIFETSLYSIPCSEGYLRPDPVKTKRISEHFGASGGRIRVGLVWGGRKTRLNADRSMKLTDLRAVLNLSGCRFISLQLGKDAEQLTNFAGVIEDGSNFISDFGDTAAILSKLDLLITIDTGIAHLSGALGVPTWIMLKYAPDWRWFAEREDSPWYDSVRLFRQSQGVLSWHGVIDRIASELKLLSSKLRVAP